VSLTVFLYCSHFSLLVTAHCRTKSFRRKLTSLIVCISSPLPHRKSQIEDYSLLFSCMSLSVSPASVNAHSLRRVTLSRSLPPSFLSPPLSLREVLEDVGVVLVALEVVAAHEILYALLMIFLKSGITKICVSCCTTSISSC
jgi:hypothetical protein